MKQPFKYSAVTDQRKTVLQWHEILNQRFEGTPRESARYYGIQILPRLLHQLEKQKSTCRYCADHFKQLEEMTTQASEWMINNDPRLKDFQKHLQQSGQHLSRQHGVAPKGLWLSRFTGIGLLAGIAVSLAVGLSETTIDLPGILMLGAAAGLAAGWIGGKIKESVLRKKHQLF
ncbi:hypothetical protein [Geofilum rubicundum]|uniref:Uncharacterized protein n=1 Tax=Geofilum rubicundum JCM 15548 TaxID=1236989 RepID=A0A0E9M1T8_9BACT|nr:hypothetical protein [Geofilum rubicundum]GAO31533.1 hypothetical protein JCM15548_13903 [Geofilum rubicundum JCM 15548]